MKKINKNNNKNNHSAQSKKITKKSTPAKKTKNSVTPKKVTKKISKKSIAKKTATKSVKKTATAKASPKRIIKKKNTTVKLKKSVKHPSIQNKSNSAKIKNNKTKILTKINVKKTTLKIKNSISPKPKPKITKTKITISKPISTNSTKNILKPVAEKNHSVSTPQSFAQQKSPIKSESNIKGIKPNIQNEKSTAITTQNSTSVLSTEAANKQFLNEAELDSYRQKLVTIRARLRGDVSTMADAALNKNRLDASGDLSAVPIPMADIGSDNFEQEQTLSFMQNERGILVDIEEAFVRIKDGTYGICEGCGNPIPKVRLNFIPYANMCVKCAELVQRQEEEDK
ncbi:MAG: TraR/DksA C4-type zinc finger protein [Planctomycetaceae bacterium]|jgi:RNA polymerase-binding transcription factor DksA|nr:TraR/DksA C4-type zinc finger protein [Planctomycetaceae bacterium]